MNVIYSQDGIISIVDEIRVVHFQLNGNDIATMLALCMFLCIFNGKGGKRGAFNVFQPKVYFVLFICALGTRRTF